MRIWSEFDEDSGWQDLCFECSSVLTESENRCPYCQAPTMFVFRRAMVKVQKESRKDDAPDEWVAVRKSSPIFYWVWIGLMNLGPLLQFVVFYQCVESLKSAQRFEEWALCESPEWILRIGLVTMLIVWVHFRLVSIMTWYYKKHVAEN